MQEQEWLACTDPRPMLRFLLGTHAPRVQAMESFPHCKGSDRKLRLFACACYYRVCHLMPHSLARDAVEVAERFADGAATEKELHTVYSRIEEQIGALEGRWCVSGGRERTALHPTYAALALAGQAVRPEAPKGAYYASSNAYLDAAEIMNPGQVPSGRAVAMSRAAEEKAQCDLLRCIFGHLFRPVTLAPAVLAWNDATVVKLAQGIYDERAFDRLGILADALEEAGCDSDDILSHLRGPGPHTRGCVVVDLVLGKS